MHADTNIEGEGCRQCDKLETSLEREHRRYIDASRRADDRRVAILRLKDGLKTIADGEFGTIEEVINFANTLLLSEDTSR